MKSRMQFLFVLLFIAGISNAQEARKGFFNLTRVGYQDATNVELKTYEARQVSSDVVLIPSETYVLSVSNITGYFFNEHFSAGVGIGIESINTPELKAIPIFLDLRAYLSKSNNTPFAYFNLGPNINPKIQDGNFQSGGVLNVGIGYQREVLGLKLQLDAAYNYKNLEASSGPQAGNYNSYKVEAMSINLGIIFF
ncbi:MAG: hypothetical protein NWQ19_05545 [Nonlabens sp.]|nr:hypothetical protein [Nonlabens sp.]